MDQVKRKWKRSEDDFEELLMRNKRARTGAVDASGLLLSSIVEAATLEYDKPPRKQRGENIVRDKSWWDILLKFLKSEPYSHALQYLKHTDN